jgi:hypothetical protein
MLARTSPRHAPWCVVLAEDKKHGRIAALTEIARRLGRGVDLGPPALDDAVLGEAQQHFQWEPSQIARLSGRTE